MYALDNSAPRCCTVKGGAVPQVRCRKSDETFPMWPVTRRKYDRLKPDSQQNTPLMLKSSNTQKTRR